MPSANLEPSHHSAGWNTSATIAQVKAVYSDFLPAMQALLDMPDPTSIKLWRLLDLEPLGTWTRGSAALIGDAAHPILPHQGQGGAQAIEDGATLGALFAMSTLPSSAIPPREWVPDRLRLYMRVRQQRATTVQTFSREMGLGRVNEDGTYSKGPLSMDPLEFTRLNWPHNAYLHAVGMLDEEMKMLGRKPTGRQGA
jgi:salicylate hydroxylase